MLSSTATITITGAELTGDLLEKIKQLFQNGNSKVNVTISVKSEETQEEVNRRIERSMENIIKRNNLVAFTGEEYEEFVRKLKNEGVENSKLAQGEVQDRAGVNQ